MATTFDTLKFARRLEGAGLPAEQAEALAEAQRDAFSEAIETQFATKADIQGVKTDIQEVKAILKLHHWMIGFNLAFTMAILWKIFS